MTIGPGPYVIEHGDVWSVDAGATPGGRALGLDRRHVCRGSERLAACYDAESGTLHKHGGEAGVEAWAAATRKKLAEAGFPEMADEIVVVAFPPTQETVAELNACVSTSGRVIGLPDRLVEIANLIPREEWPKAYPR